MGWADPEGEKRRDYTMSDDNSRPAALDVPEVIFTGPLKREVRISADHQTITHSAMDWSGTYTPERLVTWIAFYERMMRDSPSPYFKADVEVLHAARDLLVKEGVLA